MNALTDWFPVIPAEGAVKDTAKALLALADDPSHVRTTSGGTEFLVPAYLADKYTKPAPRRRPKKEEVTDVGD
ncbi:hypothetical protein [Streptomyces sp. NPDC046332]|uniref:hypothetical protein n=1 Tax=unclassified Streptomyces TaxID=2593676 RepID=UPI0033C3573E